MLNGLPVFIFVLPFFLFSFLFLPIYRKVNVVNAACRVYYDQPPLSPLSFLFLGTRHWHLVLKHR